MDKDRLFGPAGAAVAAKDLYLLEPASAAAFCGGDLSSWARLISFRPSIELQRELASRGDLDPWYVHHLEDGWGPINLDEYVVRVMRPPTIDGAEASARQLFDLLRLHLDDFIDPGISTFEPYSERDRERWESAQPLGAVGTFNMKLAPLRTLFGSHLDNIDDASVLAAYVDAGSWIFSPVWTHGDQGHPVSGNRQFGLRVDGNGDQLLFTRGADRVTTLPDQIVELVGKPVFANGDRLWRSLQFNLMTWINSRGGAAITEAPVSFRCDWDEVRRRYHQPTSEWLPTVPPMPVGVAL